MRSAEEIKQRYEYVADALGNLRLEGLELDQEATDDLMAEARGEISMDEVRARAIARIQGK